jgi:hypothetical protein
VSNSAQVIRPPNTLRMKVGGAFGGIDANAIAKAEEALKAMSAQFGQWLQDEITKLDKAQADIRAEGLQRPDRRRPVFPRPRPEGSRHHLSISAGHPPGRFAVQAAG